MNDTQQEAIVSPLALLPPPHIWVFELLGSGCLILGMLGFAGFVDLEQFGPMPYLGVALFVVGALLSLPMAFYFVARGKKQQEANDPGRGVYRKHQP